MQFCTTLQLSPLQLSENSYHELLQEPDTNQFCLSVYPTTYGCLVFVPDKNPTYNLPDGTDPTDNLPDDIAEVLAFARANNCTWILFDSDEEPNEDLIPVYEHKG